MHTQADSYITFLYKYICTCTYAHTYTCICSKNAATATENKRINHVGMFKKQWEGWQRKSHQDSPLLLRPIVSVDFLLLVRQNKQYRVIFWGPVYGHWFIRAPKIGLFHWKDKMKLFITLCYKLLLIW